MTVSRDITRHGRAVDFAVGVGGIGSGLAITVIGNDLDASLVGVDVGNRPEIGAIIGSPLHDDGVPRAATIGGQQQVDARNRDVIIAEPLDEDLVARVPALASARRQQVGNG